MYRESILFFILFTVFTASALSAKQKKQNLPTVPKVDLKRYAGQWYEVARIPNRFQKQCAGDVIVNYSLRTDGKVNVVNQCRRANGSIDKVEGVARVVDSTTNAKLEVRFAPGFLSFLPFVWGDYWILSLGENYDYAMVGEPGRKYLWLLSRKPEISPELYQRLTQEADRMGYDTSKLVKTANK
jgi:apolipoprotein D and lipocalin family protein